MGGRCVSSALVLSGFVLAACEDGTRAPSDPQDAARWDLRPSSIPVIGEVDPEDPAYSLFAADQALFIGELIAVANNRSEVRLFDRKGRHVITFGGRGDGPSEMRNLRALFRGDEGRIVILAGSRRLLEFEPDGSFTEGNTLGRASHDGNAGAAYLPGRGVLTIGRILDPGGPQPMRVHDSVPLLVHRIGRDVDSLALVPGWAQVVKEGGYYPSPLDVRPLITDSPNGAVLYDGLGDTLRVIDNRGRVVRSLATRRMGTPITEEITESWAKERREWLAGFPDVPGVNKEDLVYPWGVEPNWPERLPVYDQLLSAGPGCLWARRFRVPGADSVLFDVIDLEVGVVAELQASADLQFRDVRGAEALVMSRDELGVERVHVLDVVGPSVGPCGN